MDKQYTFTHRPGMAGLFELQGSEVVNVWMDGGTRRLNQTAVVPAGVVAAARDGR